MASFLLVHAFFVPLVEARGSCPEKGGIQLIREAPFSYNACGFPAASTQQKQIAIGDNEVSPGPTSCSGQVCFFDAVRGER